MSSFLASLIVKSVILMLFYKFTICFPTCLNNRYKNRFKIGLNTFSLHFHPSVPGASLSGLLRHCAHKNLLQEYSSPAPPIHSVSLPVPEHIQSPFYIRHCPGRDRKSTRLNSSHVKISYAVFCLKK